MTAGRTFCPPRVGLLKIQRVQLQSAEMSRLCSVECLIDDIVCNRWELDWKFHRCVFFSGEMRRLTSLGFILILLIVTYVIWQHRFERSPEFAPVTLADLRKLAVPTPGVEWLGSESKPKLRLRVDPEHPRTVARMDLPALKGVGLLHLRFQVSATDLRPGREIWEDGRCIIEWHSSAGSSQWENEPFCSVRSNQVTQSTDLVLRPDQASAIPVLRLENLGTHGDLELSSFEATVLKERPLWKTSRWLLIAGWFAWTMSWIRSMAQVSLLRSSSAAAIVIMMGIYFVIPGPWQDVRSLGGPFQLGNEIKASQMPIHPIAIDSEHHPETGAAVAPARIESVGKVKPSIGLALKLKLFAQSAKSLLHILLLLVPTLMIACLVGAYPAGSLAIILSLAIEAAQAAFGFGFDRADVIDLGCDAIGITIALWIYHLFRQYRFWRHHRRSPA